jgi:C-terminal processing protease CtpA/Prc
LLIDGRVFVAEVFSDSLKKTGIIPGLEITKIDGEPVIAYAEKNIRPYQSSSTPQDLEIREYYYALFSGPADKPVNLEFKDRKGRVFSKVVSRRGYHDVRYLPSVSYQTIGDIGYLQVNELETNAAVKQVDSLFKNQIMNTKGLIIDVRNNGGGSSGIGYNIIRKLTDKPFKTSASKVIKYYSRPGTETQWAVNETGEWQPDGKIFYDRPVIVLTGPRTFSAAEDFVVAFDYMKRGKLVGQATGGSTGQPYGFTLPGGGSARVCSKRDSYPDGKEFVGIGIQPDIIVAPKAEDLQNGTDAAKEKALALLQK